ncbi:pentatricopeptide repeat-containing protein At2g28050 [Lactuca sativa]|uniref:Pentacotripeptide-repeat region of PRORP domain-containing protein n=1 Tax=Lactuca sativa TaxID=4236 RepID=A0A9R1XQU8_LACSA|nr:pentatricopeptide repeat-containing protein At2g28050 [Lactuca sativa]KAJ0222039.1 hypothetical protein LSAT_V11C200086040 [Lactuca sativa]
MSIQKTLQNLKCIKKYGNLPTNTHRKVAEVVISYASKTTTNTETPAAVFSTLTSDTVRLVLSDRRIKTRECLSFFNVISENRSLIPFTIEIEHYVTLIHRAINSRKFEDAETLINSLANDGNLRYPFSDVVSLAESQGFDSRILSTLFNLMLKVYSDSGKFFAAFETFNYMRNNGITIDERTCGIYLTALLRCEHLGLGLVFFYKIVESGMDVSIVIDGLCQNGEIRRARQLVEAVCRSVEPNVITFNTLVNACCERKNLKELDLVLLLMEKQGVERNLETYKLIIDGFLSFGNLGGAERMIAEMHDKDFHVGIYLWNSIIHKYCKSGRMESAFQVFDEMLHRGAAPNAHTFHIMVSGICGIEKMEAAKELEKKIVRNEIELDHDIFSDLINGCCKKEKLDDIIDLLSTMEKKIDNLPSTSQVAYLKIAEVIISSATQISTATKTTAAILSTLTPNIVRLVLSNRRIKTGRCLSFFNIISENQSLIPFKIETEHYLTLICRTIKSFKFEDAETLINSLANEGNLRHPFSNVVSFAESQCLDPGILSKMFNLMLKVYTDSGKFVAAYETFSYMRNNAIAIDERTCFIYLIALLRCEHLVSGLVFFYKMVESGIDVSVYSLTVVVDRLCKNGEIKKARELIEAVCKNIEPNVITFNTLVDACCKRWNFKELDLVLLLMEKTGVELNLETHKFLVDGYLSSGKLGDAEKTIMKMHDKDLSVEIYLWNSIIFKYCKLRRMESAFQVFDKMLQRGVVPNAETFRIMVSGICGIGEMEAAKKLANKMQRKEIELGHDVFDDLINGCCKKGMLDDAVGLLSMMEKKGLFGDARLYNMVIVGLCELDRVEEASRLLSIVVKCGATPETSFIQFLANG